MRLTAAGNHAARAALGAVLASTLTLVGPLRDCFSDEVKPLLPSAAVMAIFCAGLSLEEVIWLSVEGFLGTLGAVLNAVLGRWLLPLQYVPPHSWLAPLVLLEATAFVGCTCLSPATESTKMYSVSLTAYFMMALFNRTELSLAEQCLEYLAVSSFGSVCSVIAYAVPLPWLPDTRGMVIAAKIFQEVADGCSEVIMEATAALLGQGAGEAWRSIARARLAELSSKLSEAHDAVVYVDWAPTRWWGREARSDDWIQKRAQHDAAFQAATEAIDTCRLLCELAISAHVRSGSIGAAAVQTAASACLSRVSHQAAALLCDITRQNLKEVLALDPPQQMGLVISDRRDRLRRVTQTALRNSGIAARELMLIRAYHETEDSDMAEYHRMEFMAARADMAAFLFLIHSLAAELLRIETLALRATREAEDRMAEDDSAEIDMDNQCSGPEGSDVESGWLSLERPLLNAGSRGRSFNEAARQRFDESGLVKWLREVWKICRHGHLFRGAILRLAVNIRFAVRLRWRIAVKVSLSFFCAFLASVYMFHLDSTLVSSAASLSSYGSQYDGGSLRRATTRAIGVAAGATFGAILEAMLVLLFNDAHWLTNVAYLVDPKLDFLDGMEELAYQWIAIVIFMCMVFASTYSCLLLYFRGGHYRYAGFCAGFTAIKFLLCSNAGCLNVSEAITFNMYAGLLTVFVEMMVLPIYAGDLLRRRLAGALQGSSAVLSALLTTEESTCVVEELDQPLAIMADSPARLERVNTKESTTPRVAAAASAQQNPRSEHSNESTEAPTAGDEAPGFLPDLTERLKVAGMYDKYLTWRDGYMRWRSGDGKGAKGELTRKTTVDIAKTAAKSSRELETSATATQQHPPALQAGMSAVNLGSSSSSNLHGGGGGGGGGGALAAAIETDTTLRPPETTATQNSRLGVSFTPALEQQQLPPGTVVDAIAGIVVSTFEDVEEEQEEVANLEAAPPDVMLGADRAFAEGMADFRDSSFGDGLEETKRKHLDPTTALEAPNIALLMKDLELPQTDGRTTPGYQGLTSEQPSLASGGGGPIAATGGLTTNVSFASQIFQTSPVLADVPEGDEASDAGIPHPTPQVSLSKVQLLLEEIDNLLAPALDLAAQSAERLDATRVDVQTWQRLAGTLGVVRLRLSLLARIALRLQHGVSVPELMGDTATAEAMVSGFGSVLAAAMSAVELGMAPTPRACAELEARLRKSTEALARALSNRGRQMARDRKVTEMTAEVLAGTASHTLGALLGDAGELLALACAASDDATSAPFAPPQLMSSEAADKVSPMAPLSERTNVLATQSEAMNVIPLALPDLTERLKEAGMYEQYTEWREGYMRWRKKEGQGARGEIAQNSTT